MDTRDWILLSVIFYVIVLVATAAYAFGIRRANVFEPMGQFLFFVSLFALPLPIRAWITSEIEGNVSVHLLQFEPYIPISLVLTALALPAFAAGYYSRLALHWGAKLPQLTASRIQGTGMGVLALVVLSSMLIYLLTVDIGGLGVFLLLGYKSSEATFGRGYLAVGFPWMIVAMVALLDRWKVNKRSLDMLGFIILLAVNLAIHLVTGNRGLIMYMAVVLLVFIHFRIRPLSLKLLVPLAVTGFIALNIVGSLRKSEYDSFDDLLEKTSTSAEAVGSDDKEGLFYTLTIGEFVVPFETLPQLVRTIGVTQMPWLGVSYLRAPVYIIPSFIFPDRPDSLGAWYMNNFYGGGFGLNEGRQFFFLAEGYLNFGPFGVLIVAVMWGLIWGTLHRWMLKGAHRVGTVLIYALSVGFMFRCVAGEFATLLVGLPQQSLVAVAFIFFVARLFRSPRRTIQARRCAE